MSEELSKHSVLTPIEQQVVYLTASAENNCTYCMGAHTILAKMAKMPDDVLEALREQQQIPDEKLDALRNFTLSVLAEKGHVKMSEITTFEAAGFGQPHLCDVLAIIAQKTISNFFNHMAETPLDSMFEGGAWLLPAA